MHNVRFISKAVGANENDHDWMVSTLWGNQLRFRLKTNGTTSTHVVTPTALNLNTWYHVAAVYDGSTMSIFVNGEQVGGSTAKSGSITNGSAPVTIGNQPADNKPFDGIIDDVCLFNQALTATEILDIKDNGCGSTRQPEQPVQVTNPTVAPTAVTKIQRSYYSIAGQMVGVRVKKLNSNGSTNSDDLYYMYTDHLGNVGALSDANGNYVSNSLALFRPFGEYRREPDTNPSITDRGFTGHKEHLDLGLTYMNARYYLGSIGRFISADSIVPNLMNPQSLNKYSYVNNSPINFSDPTGQCIPSECPWVTDIIIEVDDLYPYEDMGRLPGMATYEEELKWLLFIEREEASTGMGAYVEGGIMVSGVVEDGLMIDFTENVMRKNDFSSVESLTEEYNVPELYEMAAFQYYGNVGGAAKGGISASGENSDLLGGNLPKNPINKANPPFVKLFDRIKKSFDGVRKKVGINLPGMIRERIEDWLGID